MHTKQLIRFDWAIKNILRDKANFGVLEGFLSELIGTDIKILEILESESNKESAQDKINRVDIMVATKTGKSFHLKSVYRWLHEAGMSWVTSRSRHPQSNPEAQQEFKKKIPSSRATGRGQQSCRKTAVGLVSR